MTVVSEMLMPFHLRRSPETDKLWPKAGNWGTSTKSFSLGSSRLVSALAASGSL